jgi:hypothetical protein
MKRVLIICTLFGLGASAIAGAFPADMHQPKAENLQKVLQLDDAQTAKVKKVLDDSRQQRKAIREKYKPQFEAYRSDVKKLDEQTQSQLKSTLTPKQLQAYEAMHDMRRERMKRIGAHIDDDNDDDRDEHHRHAPRATAK